MNYKKKKLKMKKLLNRTVVILMNKIQPKD